MQLGVGGACGDYFGRNTQDGNGNGRADPRDPAAAIFTAARGLRREKGAPPIGGLEAEYRRAACNYYGARTYLVPYADQVIARAKAYGFQGGQATSPDAANALVDAQAGGCAEAADDLGAEGVPGRVQIAPDANFPGQPIKQVKLDFLAKMASFTERTIIVTTGTRHSILTVNGGRSDSRRRLRRRHRHGRQRGNRRLAHRRPAHGRLPHRRRHAPPTAIATARRGGMYTLEHDDLGSRALAEAGDRQAFELTAGSKSDAQALELPAVLGRSGIIYQLSQTER